MHSFNKYLLNTYCAQSPGSGSKDTTVKKIPLTQHVVCREQQVKKV